MQNSNHVHSHVHITIMQQDSYTSELTFVRAHTHAHMRTCTYTQKKDTHLKSNILTDPSPPTEENMSRPFPALVKAMLCTSLSWAMSWVSTLPDTFLITWPVWAGDSQSKRIKACCSDFLPTCNCCKPALLGKWTPANNYTYTGQDVG